ncbi:interleukin-25-like [Scomber japonicus]|uniref:interleukin-25-like n=1 Tax=Scomber japonicus TaxID=13676 RepID=UPI00230650F4|nr:interleukin-25-like [Scomber japonicus]
MEIQDSFKPVRVQDDVVQSANGNKTIPLCSALLLLTMQTYSTAPATGKSTCTTRIRKEFKAHADRYGKWNLAIPKPNATDYASQDSLTCQQAAKEMEGEPHKRALAPWKYSIDTDENRLPHKIAVAECLCGGCIINASETHDYNSVPVKAPLMVLKKTQCPHDPDKYVFKTEFIFVTVACTCVVPNQSK